MRLYVERYSKGKNDVIVTPLWGNDVDTINHTKNGKALLAFLVERVPLETLSHLAGRLNQPIPVWELGKKIREAYEEIFPAPKSEPKFTDVSIDPDLLKVIKKHCPQAVKDE